MKPIFETLANGNDVTRHLVGRLKSLSITDEAGIKSDTATFTLENCDGRFPLPAKGTVLDIRVGYAHDGTKFTGKYVVDEIELGGPPDNVTIRSKAADMRKTLKQQRSRHFEGITFGDLVAKIAKAHEYEPRVFESLANKPLPPVYQTEESDMHLLTRLAIENGAVFKPANGFLTFAPKDRLKSFSGLALAPVAVAKGDLVGENAWRYTSAERGKYAAVKARWRDVAGNSDVIVTAGGGEPSYTLRSAYPDAGQAEAAVAAKLAAFERGTVTLELNVIGRPGARAEAPLAVAGLHREVDATAWTIQRVTHRLDGSGFTTRIEAEVYKK